jgi:membrane protein required for colicin V production
VINLHPLDVFFGIILLILLLRGLFRGFVEEFGSVASVFLGILAAVLFSGLVAPLLDRYLGPSIWNQVIAFLGLFLIVYLVVKLSEAGLKNLVENAELENLDKALGFFLGLIEGLLVVFVLMFILYIQPLIPMEEAIQSSITGRLLLPLFPYAADLIVRSQG